MSETKTLSPEEIACASFTKEQKAALLKLMQGTYRTYTGLNLPKTTLSVHTTLCSPSIVVKIPTSNSVQWDTASSYITLPGLEYKIIEPDGTTRNISVNELSKYPAAQFEHQSPGCSELQGCISLTIHQVKES